MVQNSKFKTFPGSSRASPRRDSSASKITATPSGSETSRFENCRTGLITCVARLRTPREWVMNPRLDQPGRRCIRAFSWPIASVMPRAASGRPVEVATESAFSKPASASASLRRWRRLAPSVTGLRESRARGAAPLRAVRFLPENARPRIARRRIGGGLRGLSGCSRAASRKCRNDWSYSRAKASAMAKLACASA